MKKTVLGIILFLICAFAVYAVEYESPAIKVTLLNQDPSPARAGDTVELRLRVENTGGGTVQNLEIEVLQNYPFTVIDGSALQNLGTLYAYQTAKNYINTQYKLKIDKDALKGQHELKVRYRHDSQEWTTVSFNIDVTSKEFAQIIYVDKAKLEPGKETEMKFTITNIGNAPLQNLVFSWSEADGVVLPVYSDDTKYKTKAGIFVGGETDFDVAFSQSSQGQTSLSVANTGNNPAQSVSVRVPAQENFRIVGSNSAIIGNLDKGDYTVVSFQITQGSTGNFTGARQRQAAQQPQNLQNIARASGGNNNLRVIIDYTDTTGERRSVEKNVPIQFRTDTATGSTSGTRTTTQTGFFSSWTFYIIVIAAVGAGIFYRKKIGAFFGNKISKK
ncbi:hypothetical protein HYX03_01190 [Candidatus Woesearchaeota archaeon]|nr:hypothetical protein [Candidatus Woesearchaeota archaeon]